MLVLQKPSGPVCLRLVSDKLYVFSAELHTDPVEWKIDLGAV